jgi:adenosylhomocysteine nucleosidase
MKEEVDLLLQQMDKERTIVRAGIDFAEGRIFGRRAVVVKSGVGKVNAAVCTQILIDAFAVDAIIFTGVAGALDPTLDIGDIVVSLDAMHHDMDATALGFPRGTIPFHPASVFAADPALVRIALESGRELYRERIVTGRVLSGDQFVADRETVRRLHEELQGTCTEMEGAAVAQVCAMNGIPFVIVRSMSDKADGSAHINFQQFTAWASERSYRLIERMLQKL